MESPQLPRGIRWKLLTTMVGLVVVLVVFLSAGHIARQTAILQSGLEERIAIKRKILEVGAEALADNLSVQAQNDIASFNFSNLAERLQHQVRGTNDGGANLRYAILMDAARTAFVHTLQPALQQERLDGPRDVEAATRTNRVTAELGSGADQVLEITLPLRSGVQPWGTLRLGFSLAALNEEIVRTRADVARVKKVEVVRSFLIGVGFIVAGWTVVLWLATRLTRPIVELTTVAQELAKGDFKAAPQVRDRVSDEVDVLANTFVSMAAELGKSYERLEEYNRNLAEKVADRTRQLASMTVAAEDARRQAEAASNAKSAFLARMSHELRTPLTSIIGFSELLLSDAEADGRQEAVEDLNRIMASARHLLSLINEVLDLSKIEARKMELHLERFDVRKLLDEVVETLRPQAAHNDNALVIETGDGPWEACADQVKLRQCLINLLSNANKFTSGGGITLRARREPRDGRDFLVFAVSDTGIGMTAEQMGRLFQAFEQADSSISQKFGGTGLGLVITRKFCELMGGGVRVESRPGAGSTFTMDILAEVGAGPAAAVSAAAPPGEDDGARNASEIRANPPLLMVVDDDENSRETLRRQLENQSMAVLEAPDGSAALAILEHRRPQLIVCDLMMPEVDGFRFLTDLRARKEWAEIPVVILTARPIGDAEQEFLDTHAQWVIQKSDMPPSGVVHTIRQILRDRP
jgi:two-component system sensor histidine kinase/response regulator